MNFIITVLIITFACILFFYILSKTKDSVVMIFSGAALIAIITGVTEIYSRGGLF